MCLILIDILHLTCASLPTNTALLDLLAHPQSSFQNIWSDKTITNAVVGVFDAILNVNNDLTCTKSA